MHNMSIGYTSSPARRGRCRSSGMSYGFLKEASTCVIETPFAVGIAYPLAGALAVHAGVESRHGIHRASSWPATVGVRLQAACPCWFEGQCNQRLPHAVLLGWDASWPSPAAVLGAGASFDRLGAIAFTAPSIVQQGQTLLGRIAHHPVHAWRMLAAVGLGHLADCQELSGHGAHHELWEVLHLCLRTVRGSARDTALQAAYVCLDTGPVHLRPVGQLTSLGRCNDPPCLTSPRVLSVQRLGYRWDQPEVRTLSGCVIVVLSPPRSRMAFASSGLLSPLRRPPSWRLGYHPLVGRVGLTQLTSEKRRMKEDGAWSPVGVGGILRESCVRSALPTAVLALPVSLFGRLPLYEPSSRPSHMCILFILP